MSAVHRSSKNVMVLLQRSGDGPVLTHVSTAQLYANVSAPEQLGGEAR
ncbi:hypothetical protein ACFU9Y_01045 [Streptomyces sp. NPDC057621]